METNLGKPNTPVNAAPQAAQTATATPAVPATPVVKPSQLPVEHQQATNPTPSAAQVVKEQVAVQQQQQQAQTTQPTSKGFKGLVEKVAAMSPFSPAKKLEKIAKDPQIAGWASAGGKAKPPVPTMAEMMPEQDGEVAANPFGQSAPSPQNYQNGMAWVNAQAAHDGYSKYQQNPVETDWYTLNQLMQVQAEERSSMV